MKRALLLSLLVVGTISAAVRPSEAATPLPAGATQLASAQLSGYASASAVAYRDGTPYLGVVQRGRLVWHIALPASPRSVFATSASGLFGALVPLATGKRFYGFRLHKGAVAPAIQGSSGGWVLGNAGALRHGADVLVRTLDTAHEGSVRYRLVDRYAVCVHVFCVQSHTREPDYSPSDYPRPNGVVTTSAGDTILIRLQVASTEAQREQGLMNLKSLDPDSGMVFVWPSLTLESFWMENTYIPLTVAFLASDGTILETQDMDPLTTTLHTPHALYQYAIEVNKGFFTENGIKVGDRVKLTLTS